MIKVMAIKFNNNMSKEIETMKPKELRNRRVLYQEVMLRGNKDHKENQALFKVKAGFTVWEPWRYSSGEAPD